MRVRARESFFKIGFEGQISQEIFALETKPEIAGTQAQAILRRLLTEANGSDFVLMSSWVEIPPRAAG